MAFLKKLEKFEILQGECPHPMRYIFNKVADMQYLCGGYTVTLLLLLLETIWDNFWS